MSDNAMSIAEIEPNTLLMAGVYESQNYSMEGFFRYFNEDGDMQEQFVRTLKIIEQEKKNRLTFIIV